MFGRTTTRGNRRLDPPRNPKKAKAAHTPGNRRRPPPRARSRSVAAVSFAGKGALLKRLARGALRLAFAGLVTSALLLIGFLAYRHATESEYFAFEKARISGNKRLSDAEVAEIAGLIAGKNIFKISLGEAEEALLRHPWITEARVARRLPDAINVQITEREAVALVNLDVLYLVDDMGTVFKRWVRGDPIPSPIVTGISREHYLESPKEVEAVLCDAIDLANRYRENGLEKLAPLDEIHREAGGGFSLTAGTDPVYVQFGRGPYRTKLRRLASLMGRLIREGKRPEVIFFDNEVRPDRITVKLKSDENAEQTLDIRVETDEKKIMSKI